MKTLDLSEYNLVTTHIGEHTTYIDGPDIHRIMRKVTPHDKIGVISLNNSLSSYVYIDCEIVELTYQKDTGTIRFQNKKRLTGVKARRFYTLNSILV